MAEVRKDVTFEWLHEHIWNLLIARVVEEAPNCRVLWDEMAAHLLDLEVRWNRVDGAITGILSCRHCAIEVATELRASDDQWDGSCAPTHC